jgi:hypothetical protein
MEIRLNEEGDLVLTIPGSRPEVRASNLVIPCTEAGVRVIRQILTADKRERNLGITPRFVTEASPTQEMVRQYLSTHAPKVQVKIPTKKKQEVEFDASGLDLEF